MHQQGIGLSLLLHLGLILIIAVGLPILFPRNTGIIPTALTVEIVPIKDITNLKPSKKPIKKEEKKAEPPKPEKKVQATKKEVAKPVEKVDPLPLPTPEKKKPEKKKPEKKKPEATPKKEEEDDFAVLLDKLKKEATDKPKEKKKPEKKKETASKSKSESYDPTIPLSISERDNIRQQFIRCWRMPAGAYNDYSLSVKVRVLVNQDGSVREVGLVPNQVSRYQSDTFFRAAADSAIRAVYDCSPLKNLPQNKYDTWKDMELNFDPKELSSY